jgi:hypothetical protein
MHKFASENSILIDPASSSSSRARRLALVLPAIQSDPMAQRWPIAVTPGAPQMSIEHVRKHRAAGVRTFFECALMRMSAKLG